MAWKQEWSGGGLGGEELSDGLVSQENTYAPIMQTASMPAFLCVVCAMPSQCYKRAESDHISTIFLLFLKKSAVTNFSLSALISFQLSRK